MLREYEDLPGLKFEQDAPDHVVHAYCTGCGHRFTPQREEVASPHATWEAAQGSDHVQKGCDSSTDAGFTVL